MGFVATTLAVCSGTAIFPALRRASFFRMLFHLLTLSLICALATVMFRLHPFTKGYRDMCAKLDKTFGGLKRSPAGMVPAKDPDQPKTVFFKTMRVDYFPNQEQAASFEPDDDFNAGILWTPTAVANWTRLSKDAYWIMPLVWPTIADNPEKFVEFSNNLRWKAVEKKDFAKTCAALSVPPSDMMPWNDSSDFFDFKTNIMAGIWMNIPSVYGIYLFVGLLFNALLVSPLYILIFTSFSFAFGRAGTLGMKFGELFAIGIYTGFPGTIIATLYTALGLPALDYQGVYLLAYLVYSFPVFSRITREHNPENKNDGTAS
jgi:hypothetical protein